MHCGLARTTGRTSATSLTASSSVVDSNLDMNPITQVKAEDSAVDTSTCTKTAESNAIAISSKGLDSDSKPILMKKSSNDEPNSKKPSVIDMKAVNLNVNTNETKSIMDADNAISDYNNQPPKAILETTETIDLNSGPVGAWGSKRSFIDVS